MTDLSLLINRQNTLNEDMCAAIKDLVYEHGKMIRTDSMSKDTDAIYGLILDEYEQRCVEVRILAVDVLQDDVAIYITHFQYDTIKGESDEYIIEDLENWYCVNGGMVCISSTLNSIINSIDQYL